jgi:hypothetical protein
VRLRAVTSVRLECPLGHETSLLLIQLVGAIIAVSRTRSINDAEQTGKLAARANGSAHPTRFHLCAHFVKHSSLRFSAPCLRQL